MIVAALSAPERNCVRIRRAVRVLGVVMATLHLVWQLVQSVAVDAPRALPLRAEAAAIPETVVSALPALAQLHLFGVYSEPPPAPPPPVVVTETALHFRLQGVFTSSESADASALIGMDGGAGARRYQPGEFLDGGAELVSVALDHVVLRHAGQLQRLSLHQGYATGGSHERAAATRPAVVRTLRRGTRPVPVLRLPEPARESVIMARLLRLRAGGR